MAARRREAKVVEYLVERCTVEAVADEKQVQKLCRELDKHFQGEVKASADYDEESGRYQLQLRTRVGDIPKIFVIDASFFNSPTVVEMKRLAEKISQTAELPLSCIADGEELHKASSVRELKDFILQRGRKGAQIQRYKGLGEMNPEQLEETTMLVDKRTLLQVGVESAIEADRIFSILMGSDVEPRREFISDNALKVRNLDV